MTKTPMAQRALRQRTGGPDTPIEDRRERIKVDTGGHSGHAPPSRLGLMAEIDHGFTLAASALLAGLAPFAALVWLRPAGRSAGVAKRSWRSARWRGPCSTCWRAPAPGSWPSTRCALGEPFGFALFREALLESRVGAVWLARLASG